MYVMAGANFFSTVPLRLSKSGPRTYNGRQVPVTERPAGGCDLGWLMTIALVR